ncbi:excisionase family DNA-binding protein [Allobranchiibius huperziae]|uniref:Excisionase family DNA binding protein n=1 Tax=Allobranchiibius huperziae TaxID=1874116 RepID=A0A853DQZ8_9MICO|nr:helix-turn-helix domain-containing protein [Allobranchiibius huperziae]NYJ76545.1 excisionase family DNA binding protein [Allobranchiibius huperziae]
MPATRFSPSDLSAQDAEKLAAVVDDASVVTIGTVSVEVSSHGRAVMKEVLELLAAGQRVDVVPVAEFLSTQEAANLLHVSRPTLVKLLEEGALEYDQPGVHRRVARTEIDRFIAERHQRRSDGLKALAATGDGSVDQIVSTR